MKVVQSVIVIVILLLLAMLAICCLLKTIRKFKGKKLHFRHVATTVICFVLTTTCFFAFGEYANPFDQTVNARLIAVFPIEDKYQSSYPGQQFWHGAYKGEPYPDSEYFNPKTKAKYDLTMEFMYFERYSYVITYGQEIDILTYNVWETIDYPFPTGAKVGNIVFKNSFAPQTMYVYEIPKIRIENDINKTLISSYIIPPAENVFWLVFSSLSCAFVLELALLLFVRSWDERGQRGQPEAHRRGVDLPQSEAYSFWRCYYHAKQSLLLVGTIGVWSFRVILCGKSAGCA